MSGDTPTLQGIKVPDRDGPPSKSIDNAKVTDPVTLEEKNRQVVTLGDAIDHDSVGRVLLEDPRPATPGAVVRVAGGQVEELLQAILAELRDLRQTVEMIADSE